MKYGVSKNTLLITAGIIWLTAGINILRIGVAFDDRDRNVRSIFGLGDQLEVGVRMDVQVVVEGDVGVQGGVDAASGQQLDGLFQRVDALHGRAVAFGQLHVGGSEAVGRGLAGKVLEALDVLVILADGEGGEDVAVGSGEVVGVDTLLGD